ncbi:MAG TPA: cytochrome c3 family protein [Syntrophales bacterium]|nr:cytochrome c3 family protein [Syntrophales bacterium]HOU77140.1 cytochrome c3 family protein [Syntrophales bacterium]HQG33668.1 cytochrome c3 family protein [Syntrophales bacterium]HQI36100.1 cytochrome c3 family protein [Syntrophales bacterium]HQJ30026.1 cytochrome c3 family protein [Syntrophales bacterium]
MFPAIIAACCFLFVLTGNARTENTTALDRRSVASGQCLQCHDEYKFRDAFPRSVHGNIGCGGCHRGIADLRRHSRGEEKPQPVSCGSCHERIAAEYLANFHYIQEDFRCYDCHRGIHALTAVPRRDFKRTIVERCTECHSNEEYVASGHSEALLKGNQDAADCSDCHGLHNTRVYHTALDKYPAEAREFYTAKCKRCHSDPVMMKRNNLSPELVRYYEETYHGKIQSVGYASRVAGCGDCHTTHNILPKSDPRSSIHPGNLVENCGRCHRSFHPRFVDYKAHPNYRDRKNYPSLFWTFVFMSALLAGTFLFFWTHTFLWWRKTYWETHRLEKLGLQAHCSLSPQDRIQHVQRFSPGERIMHVLLILSFFILVMTGFPVKYPEAVWAGILMDLWGGAANAALFHRGAALVLIGIVVYVGWLSYRFLFPKGQGTRGWVGRLLGPDSLFPNLKDWDDLKGMIRWFFDRGEMPKFDRWTYWEKFDFLAVFWGMFAIGGSGLLLWKPEWSSYLVPGWVLNIAAMVHSEEALLAALFIFTVHFFNTHFIPTKFPMDRIVFTGTYSLEDLHEQRPLEYRRLVDTGRLDAVKRAHPGIPLKLVAAAFGLASLALGLLLTILIFWAILF